MRVPRGSERRILGARTHRELVEVRLADHDRTGFVQLGDDGCVVGRVPTVEDLRRTRRRDAARAHVVLERDGHAGERAGVATDSDQLVDLRRAGARLVGEHEVEGVNVAFTLVDRRQVPFQHVGRAGDVVSDVPGDVGGAGRDGPAV